MPKSIYNKASSSLGRALFLIIILSLVPSFIGHSFITTSLAGENESRFTIIESENGIIRLDKNTGTMSSCKKINNNWSCRPMKELTNSKATKNLDTQDEIRELQNENMKLKQKLADLGQELEAPPLHKDSKRKLKLPTDEEVDEAISYMERMIRKFGGAMKRLREEHHKVPETEL